MNGRESMQTHERISLSQRTGLMTDGTFVAAAFAAIFVVPTLLAGICLRELNTLKACWPWRNAQYTRATIISYDAKPEGGVTWKPGTQPPGAQYLHEIEYQFTAAGTPLVMRAEFRSPSQSSIFVIDREYSPKLGDNFPLYFKPENPEDHAWFVDFGHLFWQSVRRISLWGGVILAAAIMVGLIVLFYRPRRPDRSRLPEKISF